VRPQKSFCGRISKKGIFVKRRMRRFLYYL